MCVTHMYSYFTSHSILGAFLVSVLLRLFEKESLSMSLHVPILESIFVTLFGLSCLSYRMTISIDNNR